MWSNATIIPLERTKNSPPGSYSASSSTPNIRKKIVARSDRDRPGQAGVGIYNAFWWDPDTKLTLGRTPR
jgi:hypothetical protein